jgi:hypothetical protein
MRRPRRRRSHAGGTRVDLAWIDERVRGRPYGADIVIAATFEGKGAELDLAALPGSLAI